MLISVVDDPDSSFNECSSTSSDAQRDAVSLENVAFLFATIRNDDAPDADISLAYQFLASIPMLTRVWQPGEVQLLNKVVTVLANSYIALGRSVDLFRILALVKLGAASFMTGNRFGALKKRLDAYPMLYDHEAFYFKMQRMQTRRQQDISISDRVHRILEKEKIGAAGRLLEDSLGLADICPEVISKLQDLHPFEKEHKFKVRASSPVLTVKRRVVSAILRSTSKETSGGPSGLDGHFINAVMYNGAFVDLVLLLA